MAVFFLEGCLEGFTFDLSQCHQLLGAPPVSSSWSDTRMSKPVQMLCSCFVVGRESLLLSCDLRRNEGSCSTTGTPTVSVPLGLLEMVAAWLLLDHIVDVLWHVRDVLLDDRPFSRWCFQGKTSCSISTVSTRFWTSLAPQLPSAPDGLGPHNRSAPQASEQHFLKLRNFQRLLQCWHHWNLPLHHLGQLTDSKDYLHMWHSQNDGNSWLHDRRQVDDIVAIPHATKSRHPTIV